MGAPAAGEVVVVPFPFSDLTQSKVRPALCLADAGRGDRVLCQITSQPYLYAGIAAGRPTRMKKRANACEKCSRYGDSNRQRSPSIWAW